MTEQLKRLNEILQNEGRSFSYIRSLFNNDTLHVYIYDWMPFYLQFSVEEDGSLNGYLMTYPTSEYKINILSEIQDFRKQFDNLDELDNIFRALFDYIPEIEYKYIDEPPIATPDPVFCNHRPKEISFTYVPIFILRIDDFVTKFNNILLSYV
jgi:hypothetical protein